MKKAKLCQTCGIESKPCEQCDMNFIPRADKMDTARFCSTKCLTKYCGDLSRKNQLDRWANTDEIEDLRSRFERFVVRGEGCWEWTGSKKALLNYGSVSFRGKSIMAHRVSYMIHRGPIPEGLLVLHTCDVPQCTKPEHLYLGDYLDNQKDKMKRGRGKVEKLNEQQVREIKELLSQGKSAHSVSREFGVSPTNICNIKKGLIWSWVK